MSSAPGGNWRCSRWLLLAGRWSLARVMVAVVALLLLLVEGWLLLHLARRQVVRVTLPRLVGPSHVVPKRGRRLHVGSPDRTHNDAFAAHGGESVAQSCDLPA